jgi:hypothetical protein
MPVPLFGTGIFFVFYLSQPPRKVCLSIYHCSSFKFIDFLNKKSLFKDTVTVDIF